MQESGWVAATLAGDTSAFANIVNTYQRAVYNLAYRMLGDRDDAADAAQEAFLRAYAQLGTYDGTRAFSSWLLAITAHHCIDVLRKRRLDRVDLEYAEGKVDDGIGPEDTVLARERRAEVAHLLDRLPPGYRVVIVLRYWYDMACEEIAQVTGLSLSAVKTRLHRARGLLVKSVEQGTATRVPSSNITHGAHHRDDGKQGEDDRALWRSEQVVIAAPRRPAVSSAGPGVRRTSFRLQLLPSLLPPA